MVDAGSNAEGHSRYVHVWVVAKCGKAYAIDLAHVRQGACLRLGVSTPVLFRSVCTELVSFVSFLLEER